MRTWRAEQIQVDGVARQAIDYQSRDQAEMIGMFARYMSPGKVTAMRQLHYDFIPGRRDGIRIWDLDGNCFINCRSSGGVFNLGHCPPRIRAALHAAIDRFDLGDHILLSAPRALLAKRLSELLPSDLQYSFFGTSGAEVNEHAIKLARGLSGRQEIVSMHGDYFGASGLTMQASGGNWIVGNRDAAFKEIPNGDLEALAAAVTDTTAAVIMETIPATYGFLMPRRDWFVRVKELCEQSGALLIIDETQVGLGRTGRLWSFEAWDVIPDVVTVGKGPAGSYYPIAFCTWRAPHDRFFRERPLVHTSSFAGSDIGCVVALAVLDQVTEPGFFEHVQAMGARLADGLAAIDRDYPGWIVEVRGRGLLFGIEGPHEQAGFALSRACLKRGLLAIAALNRPSTMQLMPPLISEAADIDEIVAVLRDAIKELAERDGRARMHAA
jgi:acetylornithine/succinyldiaminopimelate/putrescine aminotransferase